MKPRMSLDFGALTKSMHRMQFKSNSAARMRIWRKLSHLIKDGIPLIQSIRLIQKTMGKSSSGYAALHDWISAIENGQDLSVGVKEWVENEEYMLIMSGESSGTLPQAMQSIVKGMKAKKQIRSAIIGGLAYPTFLFILAFAFLALLGYKLVPAFTTAAAIDKSAWTGFAGVVVLLSEIIQEWIIPVAGITFLIIVAFYISLPIWNSGLRIILDRYPPYAIYRILNGATWIISVSSLIESGVRIEKALELTASSSTRWAKARILGALRGLRSGRSFGEALLETGYDFPDKDIVSDIVVYSGHSGMDEALRKIGDEWLEESVIQVQGFMQVLFTVALLFVGCTILLTVLGVADLQQQLSAQLQLRR